MKRRKRALLQSGGSLALLLAGALVYLFQPTADTPAPKPRPEQVSEPATARPAEIATSEQETDASVIENLEPTGDSITGAVQDEDGNPVVGAEVVELPPGRYPLRPLPMSNNAATPPSGLSDESGRFILSGLLPDAPRGHRLMVRAKGYAPTMTDYLQVGEDVVILLNAGATLTGRLVMHDTGEPVAGHTVALDGHDSEKTPKAETDADGWFFFAYLAPWTYTAYLESAEYVLTHSSRRIDITATKAAETTLSATRSGTIEGRVVDSETGAPIPGLEVVVNTGTISGDLTFSTPEQANDPQLHFLRQKTRKGTGPSGYSLGLTYSRTDAAGGYRMTGLPPGGYHVALPQTFMSMLYADKSKFRNVTMPPGGTVTVEDFQIKPTGSVSGRVTNTQGEPVAGASISARRTSTKTGADGRYRLSGVALEKESHFRVRADGYGQHADILPELSRHLANYDVVLVPEARMEGIVVDERGTPQPDLYVSATGRGDKPGLRISGNSAGSTGPDGSFLIHSLKPGTYSVGVNQGNSPHQDIKVTERETITGLRLVYRPEGLTISGHIVDPEGMPVPYARAKVEEGGVTAAAANEHGYFRLDAPEDRTYTLVAEFRGYSNSPSVSVRAGQEKVTLTLAPGASISGRVVNAETGGPIPAYEISARGISQEVRDVQGRFHITGVSSEAQRINVTASGMIQFHLSIKPLTPGESRTGLVLRMQTSQSVSGAVVDASGQPVEGARVFIGNPPPVPQETVRPFNDGTATDAAGRFTLPGLTIGPARIGAYGEGYSPIEQIVTVPASGLEGVRLTLPSGVLLEGYLTRNGEPIADMGIGITTQHNQLFGVKTDADGYYRHEGLSGGLTKIEIRPRRENTVYRFATVLADGQPNVYNMELGGGTASITGSYLSKPDTPLAVEKTIEVLVIQPNGNTYEERARSDAAGHYRFEGLPAGQAILAARVTDSGQRRRHQLTLAEGEEKYFDFPLYMSRTLRCRISGTGRAEHAVFAYLLYGHHEIEEVDFRFGQAHNRHYLGLERAVDGEAVFQEVEPGDYTVIAIIHTPVDSANEVGSALDRPFTFNYISLGKDGDATVNLSF